MCCQQRSPQRNPMQAVTLTTSKRPQPNTIAVSDFTITDSKVRAVTITVPILDSNKTLNLTFSKQEVQAMLDSFEPHKDTEELLRKVMGETSNDNSGTPTGSLV